VYSAEAEYAMDPNHPLVMRHYTEMMANLLEIVPDLGLFSVWSQDSAAGFPWAKRLYAGANGPRGARRRTVGESVRNMMTSLRKGADAAGSNPRYSCRTSSTTR
jgi:hypothetical protein